MTLTLDRSRTYATVHGENTDGIAFMQDGVPFDVRGALIEDKVSEDKKAFVAQKMKKAARLARQADGPPAPGDSGQNDPNDDSDGPIDPSDVNFEAWLRDEVRYTPPVLFAAARKRFSKTFSNYRDLAEFLVFEEKIMNVEDVPTKLKAA